VEAGTEGSRAETPAAENDPRRDIEGANCGDALLSRSETTEDARESDGITEELLRVTAPSSVG